MILFLFFIIVLHWGVMVNRNMWNKCVLVKGIHKSIKLKTKTKKAVCVFARASFFSWLPADLDKSAWFSHGISCRIVVIVPHN